MATTVIIPARNEEKTIGKIISVFNQHSETEGRVFVGLDEDTTDSTSRSATGASGTVIRTLARGKGQVVTRSLMALKLVPGMLSTRIILCDGDYTGLTTRHIEYILAPKHGMIIGVPDLPDIDIPPDVRWAWPHVSGFRCLPVTMIPETAHGYLLETQLNIIATRIGIKIRQITMAGLKSPFQWPLSPQRQAERERDRKWGKEHGIL